MFCRIVISIFLFIFMSGHCFAQNIDNEVAEDRLIVGDTISVVIKNVPEMSGEYTVDDMGRVDLPYIGKVKASGQAPLTLAKICLLYTSPSPRDRTRSRMPSSA